MVLYERKSGRLRNRKLIINEVFKIEVWIGVGKYLFNKKNMGKDSIEWEGF